MLMYNLCLKTGVQQRNLTSMNTSLEMWLAYGTLCPGHDGTVQPSHSPSGSLYSKFSPPIFNLLLHYIPCMQPRKNW